MQLVDAARTYLGTRWKHMGRSRLGIDCVGLVILAARDLGYDMPDVDEYTRHPHGYDVVRECEARLQRASLVDVRENFVLLFREKIYPTHTGIVGRNRHGQLTIVHARASMKRVLEEVFEPHWSGLATHAFQLGA